MHRLSSAMAGFRTGLGAWALLLFAGLTSVAHGQAAGDPPGRVARLGETTGEVWLYSPAGNEWLAVGRNQPLTTGDRLATDHDARTELTLGTTTLQIDSATELQVERLDDRIYRIRLWSGSVVAALRSRQALTEFSVETDEGRFAAQSVGRFRVDRSDDASDLTVYRGEAGFENGGSALLLGAGQHARFWIDAAGVAQYQTADPVRDAFAAWSDERDRAESQLPAVRYVSPEMTGAADLGLYGNWEQSEEYGPVWYPRDVAADWVPYSTGHWSYVRPWGWSWVDAAPWGFAPFHYGRWVRRRDAWGWAPGRYAARPVYAPALVAWVGGAGFGASLSSGWAAPPVGWFPLAPREVYVPSYRTSPIYIRNVNRPWVQDDRRIARIVNDRDGAFRDRDFANRKFPHATTFVSPGVLARREPVGPAAARLRDDPLGRTLYAEGRPFGVVRTAPVTAPLPSAASPSRRRPSPPSTGRTSAVVSRDATQAAQPELRPIQPVQPIEPIRPARANPIRPLSPVRPQDTNPIRPIQPVQPLDPLRPAVVPGGAYRATDRQREPGAWRPSRLPAPGAGERPAGRAAWHARRAPVQPTGNAQPYAAPGHRAATTSRRRAPTLTGNGRNPRCRLRPATSAMARAPATRCRG